MRVKLVGILLAGMLAGCGGADAGAQLCAAEAAKRLDGQVYRLDDKMLASSRVEGADGNLSYTSTILLRPGTGAEKKQRYDCKVAPASGDNPARVIDVKFNVDGTGLVNS